jgi:Trypsin-like peptidase domain
MDARGLVFAAISAAGLILSHSSIAQNNATAFLEGHRGAIVQLRVTGKINNVLATEYGTGVLFETSRGPRIITAGHVVGPDSKWDSLADRCIYYRLAQNSSSLPYDCVVDATVDPNIDIAEVYLDPFPATTLDIAVSLPVQGSPLTVPSWENWGKPGSRATAQDVRLLQVEPDRMILSGSYQRSDSGSPVIDTQDRVVGLMIEASSQPGNNTEGIALPLTIISSFLSSTSASSVVKAQIPELAEIKGTKDVLSRAVQFGCVFLGKRSASATRRPVDMPFGLEVLLSLSAGLRIDLYGPPCCLTMMS